MVIKLLMLDYPVIENMVSGSISVCLFFIELLEEIQALGHDREASGGNVLEVN